MKIEYKNNILEIIIIINNFYKNVKFGTSNDLIFQSMLWPVIDGADLFVAIDVLGEPSSSYPLCLRAPLMQTLPAYLPDEIQPSNDPSVSLQLR